VHTEEIAVLVHSWVPERFSWRMPEYRDRGWPDKEHVRHALVDARKKHHGGLVVGRRATDLVEDGWQLTEAGAEFARPYIEGALPPHGSDKRGRVSRDEARVVRRVHQHPMYGRFMKTRSLRDVSPYEFREFLNLGPDAPRGMVERAFKRLRTVATLAADNGMTAFLDACATAFPDVVGRAAADEAEKEGA
jgi:hypothetical protein